MKQVYLLNLFMAVVYVSAAQNISAASQFATTISEIKKTSDDFPGDNYKGIWVSYYANGNRCDSGRLVDNMPHGLWKSWYSNGQLRVRMDCNARRLESTKNEMVRINNKLMYHQLYISIHPETLGPAPFTECMIHGVCQSWFEDGTRQDSGYCDNGIRQGVWEEWDETANMRAVGFYKNGMRWKDWRYYNKTGKLEFVRLYNRQEEIIQTIVLK